MIESIELKCFLHHPNNLIGFSESIERSLNESNEEPIENSDNNANLIELINDIQSKDSSNLKKLSLIEIKSEIIETDNG